LKENEALKILCEGREVFGTIDDVKIAVSPGDIKRNLRSNDYNISLGCQQDFCAVRKNGDYEIFHGHSLEEIELEE